MPAEAASWISGRYAVGLAMLAGRVMPASIGHRFATCISDQIANRQDWDLVRNVRTNQWVVSGCELENLALNDAVRTTLRNNSRALFDLYHYINDALAMQRLIVLDASMQEIVHQRRDPAGRGLMLVGLHLCGFDLVLQGMCLMGFKPLVLTIAQPQDGRRPEFEMRRKIGMNLLPASVSAMKQARKHLEQGGVVLTGMDRPIDDPGLRPCFFGRPASLPTHHIFLALKSRVPVIVAASYLQPDGKYHVFASEPVEMQHYPSHDTEILYNAEAVLRIAEKMIRQAPQQWCISLPVWPEALKDVPSPQAMG